MRVVLPRGCSKTCCERCWLPPAGHRSRARQSTTRPPQPPNRGLILFPHDGTPPALHRVPTGRIPRSPGLGLGPVPTGLVLVVELVLAGLTIAPPPKPRPTRKSSSSSLNEPPALIPSKRGNPKTLSHRVDTARRSGQRVSQLQQRTTSGARSICWRSTSTPLWAWMRQVHRGRAGFASGLWGVGVCWLAGR